MEKSRAPGPPAWDRVSSEDRAPGCRVGAEPRSSLWGLVVGPGSSLQRLLSGWAIAPGSGGQQGQQQGPQLREACPLPGQAPPGPGALGRGTASRRKGATAPWRGPGAPQPHHWPQVFRVPGGEGILAGPGTQGHQQPDAGQPAKTRLSPGQAVWVPRPGLLAAHSLHSRFFSRPRFSSRFPHEPSSGAWAIKLPVGSTC